MGITFYHLDVNKGFGCNYYCWITVENKRGRVFSVPAKNRLKVWFIKVTLKLAEKGLKYLSFPIFYNSLCHRAKRSCCLWQHRHLAQKTLWKASFSERFYVQSVSITLCWKPFGIINYKMGKLKKIMSCIILQVMIYFFYKIKFLTHIVLKVGK